jgi:hypothetical protein
MIEEEKFKQYVERDGKLSVDLFETLLNDYRRRSEMVKKRICKCIDEGDDKRIFELLGWSLDAKVLKVIVGSKTPVSADKISAITKLPIETVEHVLKKLADEGSLKKISDVE